MFGRTKHETTLTDFAAAHAAGSVTVDVREPGEYLTGHVPGARNVPLGRLGEQATQLVAEAGGAPVYVVCASGNRSKAGASLLARAGGEALSVAGGTGAWTKAGHPVVTGSRAG